MWVADQTFKMTAIYPERHKGAMLYTIPDESLAVHESARGADDPVRRYAAFEPSGAA
jgi:hypothetical protein